LEVILRTKIIVAFLAGAMNIIGCQALNLFDEQGGPYDIEVFNAYAEEIGGVNVTGFSGYVAAGEFGKSTGAMTSQVTYPIPEKATISWVDPKGAKKEQTVEIRSKVKDPSNFRGTVILDISGSGVKVVTVKTTEEVFAYERSRNASTRPTSRPANQEAEKHGKIQRGREVGSL